MNRIKLTVAALLVLGSCLLTACGGYSARCHECGKQTSEAYYTMAGDTDSLLCSDCARSYWMPFDYRQYKVEKKDFK